MNKRFPSIITLENEILNEYFKDKLEWHIHDTEKWVLYKLNIWPKWNKYLTKIEDE